MAESSYPLIFVDFDGVLLTVDYQLSEGPLTKRPHPLDPSKVRLLASVVWAHRALIVVSSNWRDSCVGMTDVLARSGLARAERYVVGVTPRINGVERGTEIKAWLEGRYGIRRSDWPPFCILDDEDDMGELRGHLVRTNPYQGLQPEHIPLMTGILAGSGLAHGAKSDEQE